MELAILEGLGESDSYDPYDLGFWGPLKKIKVDLKPVQKAVERWVERETEKVVRAGKKAAEAAQETFQEEYQGKKTTPVRIRRVPETKEESSWMLWVLGGILLYLMLKN